MRDRALGLATLGVVLLLPWTVFIPLYGWPMGVQIGNVPTVIWHLIGLLVLAAIVATRDRWLGLFAAYIALDALRSPIMARPWVMANAVVIGAVVFAMAREMPSGWRARVRLALTVSGLAQAAVTLLQEVGWDPFWPADAPFKAAGTMAGTIGNDTWAGAYLSIVGALAPWWAVPGIAIGILCTRSRVALLALGAAIVVRLIVWARSQRGDGRRWVGSLVAGLSPAVVYVALRLIDKTNDTLYARLAVWRLGLRVWWEHSVLFGLGPGSWSWYIPQFNQAELFLQAHNEALQLLFETGCMGVGLLALWMLAQRRWLVRSPVAWALAITALGTFPFHIAIVGATGLIALAMDQKEEADEQRA